MVVKGRKEILSVSVSVDLVAKLREVVKREGTHLSAVVEEAIKEYIERHGLGNPNFKLDDFAEARIEKAWPTLGTNPEKFDLSGFSREELEEMLRYAEAWRSKIAMAMAKGEEPKEPSRRLAWLKYRCLDCGHEFGWWHEVYECPKCKSKRIAYLGLETR